jgi:hypothetical protein
VGVGVSVRSLVEGVGVTVFVGVGVLDPSLLEGVGVTVFVGVGVLEVLSEGVGVGVGVGLCETTGASEHTSQAWASSAGREWSETCSEITGSSPI